MSINFYKDSDLMIGSIINVFGRKMLLTDCDQFTKEYYSQKFGIDKFDPIDYSHNQDFKKVERINPPYTGFGSEEDSLASCQKMIPEPPKKDFVKWMYYDRNGLDSNNLRFLAKLQTNDPIQADRRFIVSYFLSDDSILVYEPPVKNSGKLYYNQFSFLLSAMFIMHRSFSLGINGGRFLERMKIKKPNQPPFSTKLPEYYTYKDLYVGAVLVLNNFYFKLYDADQYCYNFMEKNSNSMFPYSNGAAVFNKIKSMLNQEHITNMEINLKKSDPHSSGLIGFANFYSIIKAIFGMN